MLYNGLLVIRLVFAIKKREREKNLFPLLVERYF